MRSTPSSSSSANRRSRLSNHFTVFIVVIVGLATLNLLRNLAHLWFSGCFVLGYRYCCHDVALLIKFRPKRFDEAQTGGKL